MAFNEKVSTPPGETGKTCFYNHLAIATPENKAYLSSWVDKTVGVGLSQYDDALKEAFAFFKISGDVPADPRQRRKLHTKSPTEVWNKYLNIASIHAQV